MNGVAAETCIYTDTARAMGHTLTAQTPVCESAFTLQDYYSSHCMIVPQWTLSESVSTPGVGVA